MRTSIRNPLMDKIGALLIGILLVILGYFLLQNNNKQLDEYKNSSDKQTVVAKVVDVYVNTETRRSNGHTKKVTKYECKLEYTLKNGNLVSMRETYYDQKRVGDTITLNIYKNKYGDYQIARITSEQDKKSQDLIAHIMMGFGVLFFISGLVRKLDYC